MSLLKPLTSKAFRLMCEWQYSYRSSENRLLDGQVRARSRDAAFAALKAQGVKPIRVELAPGLVNWVRSLGCRWLAILVLVGLIVVLVAINHSIRKEVNAIAQSVHNRAAALPRQRIPGIPPDLAIRLPSIFSYEAERFLALCAEPGIIQNDCGVPQPGLGDLERSLSHDIVVSDGDDEWVATLKRVVVGMKDDAALLLKEGKSSEDIKLWLSERQKMELTYRNQIIMGPGSMKSKARKLRAMGL